MIVDKDTGKVYDLRKEEQVDRLCARQTRIISGENSLVLNKQPSQTNTTGKGAWGDWWRDKKKNN